MILKGERNWYATRLGVRWNKDNARYLKKQLRSEAGAQEVVLF